MIPLCARTLLDVEKAFRTLGVKSRAEISAHMLVAGSNASSP